MNASGASGGQRGVARRFREWRFRRRLAGPRLVAAFAKAHPDAVFVEVGANDGMQHDHLREAILASAWRGVMVEPLPYVFARLRANYGGNPRVRLENAALGAHDGTMPFFHLAEAGGDDATALPSWYDGIGSFSRRQVLGHASEIPGIEARLTTSDVPCLTWESLLRRHHLTRVDLVIVDVEGYDGEVVRQVLASRIAPPRVLVYEHYHLEPAERARCRDAVLAAGYEVLEEGFDTWCLRIEGADPRLAAAWRTLAPGMPALSVRDRAPAGPSTLYDTSVPLPPGAEAALRADNPRLLELRAAYRALDLPALAASRWRRASVEAFLDLPHFRGETLITWHYRDAPEVTRRRYQAFADYVAARDRGGLLQRLGEDGAFGCWTFEVEGHGRVSRDLLQSVNEIAFLDRRLERENHRGLRVLDIGAGYGRLAHRLAQAHANLADYCCIDAVPEATFVSEYYLGFRAVAPPARVVSLEHHDELEPGAFDLALNIHSFSECPYQAVEWWLGRLRALAVPHLLLVPNEPTQLLSLEVDNRRRDLQPLLTAAGYHLAHREPVFDDPDVRRVMQVDDHFHLFELRP